MRTIRDVMLGMLFVAIGLAGVLKLLALDEFAQSLETWDVFPARTIVPASLFIPLLELAACTAWFAFAARRTLIEAAAFSAILAATGVYAFQAWTSEPPSCGCLGLWQAHYDRIATGQTLVWRNGVILLILGTSILTRLVKGDARASYTRVHPA